MTVASAVVAAAAQHAQRELLGVRHDIVQAAALVPPNAGNFALLTSTSPRGRPNATCISPRDVLLANATPSRFNRKSAKPTDRRTAPRKIVARAGRRFDDGC